MWILPHVCRTLHAWTDLSLSLSPCDTLMVMPVSEGSRLILLPQHWNVVAGAHMGFFERTDTLFNWTEMNYVNGGLTL